MSVAIKGNRIFTVFHPLQDIRATQVNNNNALSKKFKQLDINISFAADATFTRIFVA